MAPDKYALGMTAAPLNLERSAEIRHMGKLSLPLAFLPHIKQPHPQGEIDAPATRADTPVYCTGIIQTIPHFWRENT